MTDTGSLTKKRFRFGSTTVAILEGNILKPPGGVRVEAVASTDDNYLTMGSGISKALRKNVGNPEDVDQYIAQAQADCPVKAGTVVVTGAYRLQHRLGAKHVLHGTVVDYDTEEQPLDEMVELTTHNCLQKTEELGLRSILLPAFASGSGKLPMDRCARRMCWAIKSFLAQERSIKRIYIILYSSGDNDSESARRNEPFIREANLVLGVPYNPARDRQQSRDFYGRGKELAELEEIITGKRDGEGGKRHVVILGGPSIGKWALLERIYCLAQEPGSPLSEGRRLVRLTFGRVHENTPLSFIYRKFLCTLHGEVQGACKGDEELRAELKEAYADPAMDCTKFLVLLERHKDRYPEIVFLVDKLPRLLEMEDKKVEMESGGETEAGDQEAGKVSAEDKGVQDFWQDLDRLQERVRFVYTARDEDYEELRKKRLEPLTMTFLNQIIPMRVTCITHDDRREWVDKLFRRYLRARGGAPELVHDFMEEQAGRHPFLAGLLGYAVVERLKRELLKEPIPGLASLNRLTLNRLCEEAFESVVRPRNLFFEELINVLRRSPEWDEYRWNLENLAEAIAAGETEMTAGSVEENDLRRSLDINWLRELARRGLLVDDSAEEGVHFEDDDELKDNVQFTATSFATYVKQTLVDRWGPGDQPDDVAISILAPRRGVIRTIFRDRRAKVITAEKPLTKGEKREFMESFWHYLHHRFREHGEPGLGPSVFPSTQQVGNYILSQFTTVDIKHYLRNAPRRSTVMLMIDDAFKEIPWELMLEAAYSGEIPFQVGRTIVSKQAPRSIRRPVRGIRKIKALLIGNPSGHKDLQSAEDEVKGLADTFRRYPDVFEEPDLLLGSEGRCQRIQILNALSSGKYGLVHYSGHTGFRGHQSAWQVADDNLITTDSLTNAVQMAPPVLVFSSSCESAVGGEKGAVRYEGQTFDLPGAFLQAGVEAYIGTLWRVDSNRAGFFSEEFYRAFLSGKHELGECLRRAKWARKQLEEWEHQIDWLAFVLYGDPHLKPADLFPAMHEKEDV